MRWRRQGVLRRTQHDARPLPAFGPKSLYITFEELFKPLSRGHNDDAPKRGLADWRFWNAFQHDVLQLK
jgi:hypothetical protein